jgi:hypothetical protein
MALQTSGAISLNNVNVELGNSGTAYITMGSAAVRGLFDISSGAISMSDGYGKSDAPAESTRGVWGGGWTSTFSNVMDYVTLATTGNATDFGNLSSARRGVAGCSSSTRGLFMTGADATTNVQTIDYITVATTGNTTNFGKITIVTRAAAGLSNGTRGIIAGGEHSAAYTPRSTRIDYVTIATTGDGTEFGSLSVGRNSPAGCANSTRGIIGGGNDAALSNVIDYITIDTTGNATDFGNLSLARMTLAAAASATRGVFAGGSPGTSTGYNVIDYVTIASTGNATDFGNLSVARGELSGCSSATRGVFGGGYATNSLNVIDYVTIASTGNATDFGNITVSRRQLACLSGY